MKFPKRLLACMIAAMLLLPAAACARGEGEGEKPEPEDPPITEDPGSSTPAPVYELAFQKTDYLLATVEQASTASAIAALQKDGAPAEGTVVYEMKDPAVAAYADGTITAVGAGKTTLTASYEADGQKVTATAAVTVLAETEAEKVNAFAEGSASLFGRTYFSGKQLVLDNVCTGTEVAFYGTSLTCGFASTKGQIRYFVDGDTEGTAMELSASAKTLEIKDLEAGLHVVRILKASSPSTEFGGAIRLAEAPLATDGTFLTPPPKPDLKIEFLGDSITAGAGALGTSAQKQTIANSDPTKAYSYLTAQKLDADFSVIAVEGMCAKYKYLPSSPCGYETYLTQSVNSSTPYEGPFDADIVVLAFGENDFYLADTNSNGYTLDQLRTDYADMLALIREKNPDAFIVCVYGMMPYSARPLTKNTIEGVIADMGDSKVSSVFMMSNEQGANAHPNAAAHKTNANRLVKHIRSLLGQTD